MTDPVDDFLEHFGVKGMKWGVRKELQRNSNDAIVRERNILQTKIPTLHKEITKEEYAKLDTSAINLGSTFKRVAGLKQVTLSDVAYVTSDENDHKRYLAMLSPAGPGKDNAPKSSLTVKTSSSAMSPGDRERVDLYIKSLNSEISPGYTGRDYLLSSFPQLANLNSQELGLKTYRSFVQSQVMDTPLRSLYFKEVKDRGYNALVDDADKGFMAKTPAIIFTASAGARVTEVKPIYKEDVWLAATEMKSI